MQILTQGSFVTTLSGRRSRVKLHNGGQAAGTAHHRRDGNPHFRNEASTATRTATQQHVDGRGCHVAEPAALQAGTTTGQVHLDQYLMIPITITNTNYLYQYKLSIPIRITYTNTSYVYLYQYKLPIPNQITYTYSNFLDLQKLLIPIQITYTKSNYLYLYKLLISI